MGHFWLVRWNLGFFSFLADLGVLAYRLLRGFLCRQGWDDSPRETRSCRVGPRPALVHWVDVSALRTADFTGLVAEHSTVLELMYATL